MSTVIVGGIGGGSIQTVPVLIKGKVRYLKARIGLEESDIGVIVSGHHRGKPIVPRWDWVLIETLKAQSLLSTFDPAWLVYVMYDNLYAVRRYTMHVAAQYGLTFEEGKRADLLRIQELFAELNRLALGLRTTNAADLAKQFEQLSGEIIVRIGARPDVYRNQRIANAAAQLGTVVDSLKRVNPSAKAAVAVGGGNQAHGRLVDINHIEEVLTSRQRVADLLVHTMELSFAGMHDFLAAFAPVDGLAAPPITDCAHAEMVSCALELFTAELKRYDIVPFRNTARHLLDEFASAARQLRQHKHEAAATILRMSANSLTLRQVRISLECAIVEVNGLLEQERIDPAQRDTIAATVAGAKAWISNVDETGFQHPVVRDASQHIETAMAFLGQSGSRALKQAKQALKQAAALL
ncbi:MAG: hypothetical protein PHY34_06335 [Patescibacteria group bacterium]|nr:hypothetical protein [Patescibacteria group bacterium]MDD5715589.1 hypothetical protein [Patescibacteria group bacterium]